MDNKMASTSAPNRQAKITLYWLNKSRSQRILWLLEELGLSYEVEIFKRTPQGLAPESLKEIHPLGKAPVISITPPGATEPIILAESGFIVEYLTEYYGPWLNPKKFPEGKEGHVGQETEQWRRTRTYMHYAEGSMMVLLVLKLVINNIRNSSVPFFIKPITGMIAGKVDNMYLDPNFKTHFDYLESQLASAPDGGPYLCGKELTGADILMSFPLEAAQVRGGMTREKYPKLNAYVDKLHERPAYKRAVDKIIELEGTFDASL